MSEAAKTRKNNISKRARIKCFQEALPSFLEESKKYQPVRVIEPEWKERTSL